MKALIIIDMVNDFVTGALANEKYANQIIPNIQKLIEHARKSEDWLVVYSNDAHDENDREISVWGRHSIAGTQSAQVIDALKPIGHEREIISPKHFYSSFSRTGLKKIFTDKNVTDVYLVGQHTHCCVRHTAYSAFKLGYKINILNDGVCVFEGVDNNAALDYLKTVYGANITSSNQVISS